MKSRQARVKVLPGVGASDRHGRRRVRWWGGGGGGGGVVTLTFTAADSVVAPSSSVARAVSE